MRYVILFVLLLPVHAAAQSWAPVGAKWTYKQHSIADPDTVVAVLEVTGDTMVGGRLCRNIRFVEGWSGCHAHLGIQYMSNDSLYFWHHHAERFELLFRWDAVPGDLWSVVITDDWSGGDTLHMTVLDTSQVDLGGVLYRRWQVGVVSQAFVYETPIYDVVERLGPAYSPFTWRPGICDGEMYNGLRCYEDPELNWQSPAVPQCALSTGVHDLAAGAALRIFPNPVERHGVITLEVADALPGQDRIVLQDALGRIVQERGVIGPRTDMAAPPGGMWVVSLVRDGVRVAQHRLVVQ